MCTHNMHAHIHTYTHAHTSRHTKHACSQTRIHSRTLKEIHTSAASFSSRESWLIKMRCSGLSTFSSFYCFILHPPSIPPYEACVSVATLVTPNSPARHASNSELQSLQDGVLWLTWELNISTYQACQLGKPTQEENYSLMPVPEDATSPPRPPPPPPPPLLVP